MRRSIVSDVTLDIAEGVTCLLGPNGAGKTTLFKSMLGLLPHASGKMRLLGLADRAYTELSGGERQLVLIARALAQKPRILIMDEPTASLDYGNQMRVLDQVRALADDGMTVLLSTHHPDHALRISDAVALIFNGRLHAHGAPRDVLTADMMRMVYGVDVVIGALPGAASSSIAPRSKEHLNGP